MFEFGKDFFVNEFLLRVDAQYFRLAVYRIRCSYCRFIVSAVSLFLFLNIFIASLLKSPRALCERTNTLRDPLARQTRRTTQQKMEVFAKEHR